MSAFVHVQNDSVALVEVVFDVCGLCELALEAVAEGLDGAPHKEVPVDVAAVGAEPGVQILRCDILRVDVLSAVVQNHSYRGHEATCLAYGVAACAQLVVGPLRIALLEEGVGRHSGR